VSTSCTQFRVSQVAVRSLGEAAMAERGKRKFFAEAGGADDLLHDFAEVPEILFFGDPRKRCAAPAVCVVPPEDEAGDRGLLDLVKLGHQFGEERFASIVDYP